ncbi:MAG: hypothetical protein PHT69_14295 [Bacteroidales bacterium]|nr:hypothetical protein [Bacteroidales bacterium]
MKYYYRFFTVFLVVLFFMSSSVVLKAQHKSISLSAEYGLNFFMGDIKGNITGSGGMAASYEVFSNLNIGYGFNFGTFSGQDATLVFNNHSGLQFNNNFVIHGVLAKYKFSHLLFSNPLNKHKMEFSLGYGLINFRDRLETLDGDYLAGFGYHSSQVLKEEATNEFFISVGLNYKYQLNKNLLLGIEPTFIFVDSDKLDFIFMDDKKDNYLFLPLFLEYKLFTKPL